MQSSDMFRQRTMAIFMELQVCSTRTPYMATLHRSAVYIHIYNIM